ncbi:hypothetical protein B7494_g5327 [Chlorociboria aeruginascens]|nr:hypothetical protein B7494_g5327 [Chlorociboria aeruginascens]
MASSTPSSHFFRLPIEVQSTIWSLAFPDPRLVHVRYSVTTGKFSALTPPPVRLVLNREARYQVVDEYGLHFGTRGHPATIRINFHRDIVNLDWEPLRLGAIGREELNNIRWLEIGGRDLQRARSRQILQTIISLPSLKQVAFVSPSTRPVIPGRIQSHVIDLVLNIRTMITLMQAEILSKELNWLANNSPQTEFPRLAGVVIIRRDGTRDYSSNYLHRPAE